MRISDWSSDVCSSDLLKNPIVFTPSVIHLRRMLGTCWHIAGALGGGFTKFHRQALRAQVPVAATHGGVGPGSAQGRSEERRVGKEGVRTCQSRVSPDH